MIPVVETSDQVELVVSHEPTVVIAVIEVLVAHKAGFRPIQRRAKVVVFKELDPEG